MWVKNKIIKDASGTEQVVDIDLAQSITREVRAMHIQIAVSLAKVVTLYLLCWIRHKRR